MIQMCFYSKNTFVSFLVPIMKYVNTDIVFQEFPDEVTLAINISGCPCRCPGCHSAFLWRDEGMELTPESLAVLIAKGRKEITCIGFMGGDADPLYINELAKYIKERYKGMRVGWYSGRTVLPPAIDLSYFDYVKIGPYIKHLGGLDSEKTNQKMYKVQQNKNLQDITYRFKKGNIRL